VWYVIAMRNTAAFLFALALVATSCGESTGNGGAVGTTGSGGGNGGDGGGWVNSTCGAICGNNCTLAYVPLGDVSYDQCVAACDETVPQFNDDCGWEATEFLRCMDAHDCNPDATDCTSEAVAWGTCSGGI
jgi:hypothetical protein